MSELANLFLQLPPEKRKDIMIQLCSHARDLWLNYVSDSDETEYYDRNTGAYKRVDLELPGDAIASVIAGVDTSNVGRRYADQVQSIKVGDLNFGEDMTLAYWSIFHLYQRYIEHGGQLLRSGPSDWTIINQALSVYNKDDLSRILHSALAQLNA